MAIFDFNWAQIVWSVVTLLVAGGVVAGAVLVVRHFVRLDRRVEDLARDVAALTRGPNEAGDRDGEPSQRTP